MLIATAGHIDHGKTLLVKALTGVDADRLPEEKRRGMTIDLGFAYARDAADGVLGFVDVPGHERFVATMLAGVAAIDFALLVVAADDGPMPQTREHVAILDLLGVPKAAVALNKIDRVPTERAGEVTAELTALLAGTRLADAPVFPLSALTGTGVPELAGYLRSVSRDLALRRADGNFRLAIDRCFSLTGAGLIVTGTAFAGQVAVGERLTLLPSGIEARVRGLHAGNREAEAGSAGQRLALNLAGPGLERQRIGRGQWAVSAPAAHTTRRFDAELRVLPGEARALAHWTPVHLHHGSADLNARVAILGAERIAPGASGLVQLLLDRPTNVVFADRFVLRDQSAQRTLAGGSVIDPFPPPRGRERAPRLDRLALLAEPDTATLAGRLLETAADGLVLEEFAAARNLTPAAAEALWRRLALRQVVRGRQQLGFTAGRWQGLLDVTEAALAQFHAAEPASLGPDEASLRRLLPEPCAPETFAAVLRALLDAGRILRHGLALKLPSHRPRQSQAEMVLWQQVEPLLRAGALRPPIVREIAAKLGREHTEIEAFLLRMAALGLVVRVADNRFFPPDSVRGLAELAAVLAGEEDDGLTAARFRDRSAIGRNLTIEVLEFFDRVGLTRRVGPTRRLRRQPEELFGKA
ncbi:MAG: selenocysteine-specific translation elongation factor [Alphaproteobacteria bacterium]|nr:selenocysteine-specific translation elongation factor [Alphaproteobacteria bacterium]